MQSCPAIVSFHMCISLTYSGILYHNRARYALLLNTHATACVARLPPVVLVLSRCDPSPFSRKRTIPAGGSFSVNFGVAEITFVPCVIAGRVVKRMTRQECGHDLGTARYLTGRSLIPYANNGGNNRSLLRIRDYFASDPIGLHYPRTHGRKRRRVVVGRGRLSTPSRMTDRGVREVIGSFIVQFGSKFSGRERVRASVILWRCRSLCTV